MVTTPHKLSNLQLELLKLFSYQVTEQELSDIKDLLALYFAQRASDAMDQIEFPKIPRLTIDEFVERLDENNRNLI